MAGIRRNGSGAILGTIRSAEIVTSKPLLSAEIISMILDHLAASDLIKCACVSKRTCEMVYDDTRWVRRLRAMGCWDEATARSRGGKDGKRSLDALAADDTSDDHDTEGFNVVSRSRVDFGFSSQPAESRAALSVLSTIRSARGLARQEYGRAHASLYPFYMDSIQVRVPSNARIFRVYRHPNEQAQIIAQIERFARSDFASGNTGRRVAFSTLVQAFEDAVSREFEQGMSLQDVDGRMKKYAHVLVTLNGGQRAAQCFVSANPIFRDAQAWGDPMDCVSSTHANVLLLEESTGFFQQVSTETRSQLDVIRRVFPPTLDVMHSLLLRVVNDLVRPYLCSLFDNTRQRDVGMFLEAVSGTYRRGLEFINSLNGPSCVSAESGQMRLSELVDNIYGPYFEAYLPRDLETFKEKSTTEIWRWEQQMSEQGASSGPLPASSVTRQAAKRDFLSSFKNVILAPVNALPALPWASAKSPTDVQSPGRPLGHDSHDLTRSATRKEVDQSAPRTTDALALPILEPNAEQVSDLAAKAAVMKTRLEHIKSLFSLELSLNLIQLAKASMERTAVFASASGTFHQRARSQCETVFVLLVRTLGSQHVQKGLDQAVEHLSSYNPSKDSEHRSTVSVAPLMVFFELVNVCDLIQQMLDVFFEQELVATRIVEPGDSLSPAIKEKKRFEQMLDDRVAAGLNRGIEVLMTEVEYVLSAKQRVEDFNPGASGSVITDVADVGPSNAALVIIEVVSGHTQMLKGSADKNILDVFNQEIGLRLFAALCKHLKRQRISVRGAIRLISDINLYFDFIETLKNKDLLLYFRALRELSQLYLISPTDAKDLAGLIADGDRFQGIFRAEEVYEFAERRADWFQIKPKVERAMYGIGCFLM